MFDNDVFYPTPDWLVRRMLKFVYKGLGSYDLVGKNVLDPSAGKGDILDVVKSYNGDDIGLLSCIEIDVNLQSILLDKGYRLIGYDFLSYDDFEYWDLIIMNPPFNRGVDHLLKAIEISSNTDIVCLLNAETIMNPCTKKRKLLLEKIRHLDYDIEIIDNAFSNSERKTDVRVAMIRLRVEDVNSKIDFDLDKEDFETLNFNEDFVENTLARKEVVNNLIVQKETVLNAYKDMLKKEVLFLYYFDNMCDFDKHDKKRILGYEEFDPYIKYNKLRKTLNRFMWNTVINSLDIERYMSSKVRNNFNQYLSQQSNISFTKENVAKFFMTIMNNRTNILDQAIVDVFDELTLYYHENRNHVEGWKTNKRYKINRKVIIPNVVEYGQYMTSYDLKTIGSIFSLSYNSKCVLTDLQKACAYIMGHTVPVCDDIKNVIKSHFHKIGRVKTGEKFENELENGYFSMKFYKKGTLHLYFKNKKLWDEFNMRACNGKQWLPEDERSEWQKRKSENNDIKEHYHLE